MTKTKGFEKRAQFYASKAYGSQANVGDEYENLKEVVFLAIADYVMFPKKKALKSDHIILDRDTFEHDLTDFSFTFLELGKFTKTKEDIDALANITEKWCYFFKYADEVTAEDLEKLIGEDKIIEKAYKELNQFYWTEGELLGYEAAMKKERDYKASMDQKFDDGKAEGKAEGLSEGKRQVALEMLNDNEPDSKIIKYAKISAEELTQLKMSLVI